MQFIIWLGSMLNGVWHILDFDLLGIGINLNILLLGLSVFAMFIAFFKRIGGLESGGIRTYMNYTKKQDKE